MNTTTTEHPATPRPLLRDTSIDQLERNRTVNVYVDKVAFEDECTSIECHFSDNLYARYQAIVRASIEIPGADVDPFQTAIRDTFASWNDCLMTAPDFLACYDEMAEFELSFRALYDALR